MAVLCTSPPGDGKYTILGCVVLVSCFCKYHSGIKGVAVFFLILFNLGFVCLFHLLASFFLFDAVICLPPNRSSSLTRNQSAAD